MYDKASVVFSLILDACLPTEFRSHELTVAIAKAQKALGASKMIFRFCVGKSLPRASVRQAVRISYFEKLFSIHSKPVFKNFNLYNYIILCYIRYVIIVIIPILLGQKSGSNTSNENL